MENNKKRKIYSYILSSLATGLLFYNASVSISGGNISKNQMFVESLDDSRSLIHSNSGTSDILFEKQFNGDMYHYSLTNCDTGESMGKFTSPQNISMDSSVVQNPKLCAAAWAIVHAVMTGGNVAAALAAAFGVASGIAQEGTLIAAISLAIESGGWAAVGAVIGILSASEAVICLCGIGGVA